MGRIGFFLSEWGLLIVGLIVVVAVLRFWRRRGEHTVRSGDPFLPDADSPVGVEQEGAERPAIFPDFAALLEGFVMPRHRAHPDWDRLDGAQGVKGRPLAWFDRGGTVYGVNGETRFDPLLAAHAWILANPGEDPLVVRPTRRAVGRLMLRPEVGWTEDSGVRIETG